MKNETITSVAKLVNRYIADLTAKAQVHENQIVHDLLDGDRFTVKVFENYNRIEIVHSGACSEWFRHQYPGMLDREKLTALIEERGWHCDESREYHTVYMAGCAISITTHAANPEATTTIQCTEC